MGATDYTQHGSRQNLEERGWTRPGVAGFSLPPFRESCLQVEGRQRVI